MKLKHQIYRQAIAFSIGWIVFVTASITIFAIASIAQSPPTNVSDIRPDEAAAMVYEQLPEFPRENQYVSMETKEVATQNTLIERLIRYHTYLKDRPINYRLDWKLTLADYLGINEVIPEARYPGNTTLTQNPYRGDREVINNLSHEQRNQLVETLLSIYNPQANAEAATTNSPPTSQPTLENNDKPQVPQRGSADLLLP